MKHVLKYIQSFMIIVSYLAVCSWCYAELVAPKTEKEIVIEIRVVKAFSGWGLGLKEQFNQSLYGLSNSFSATMPGNSSSKQDTFQIDYFSFGIQKNAWKTVQLEFQKLENEGRGKSISTPRLMVTDSVTMNVEQGIEISLSCSPTYEASVGFIQSLLTMEVTPHIKPDGLIQLDLFFQYSFLKDEQLDSRDLKTRRYHFQMQTTVENGGVAAIGVPYPMREDVYCTAYSTPSYKEPQEYMLFITPRIVDDDFRKNLNMN